MLEIAPTPVNIDQALAELQTNAYAELALQAITVALPANMADLTPREAQVIRSVDPERIRMAEPPSELEDENELRSLVGLRRVAENSFKLPDELAEQTARTLGKVSYTVKSSYPHVESPVDIVSGVCEADVSLGLKIAGKSKTDTVKCFVQVAQTEGDEIIRETALAEAKQVAKKLLEQEPTKEHLSAAEALRTADPELFSALLSKAEAITIKAGMVTSATEHANIAVHLKALGSDQAGSAWQKATAVIGSIDTPKTRIKAVESSIAAVAAHEPDLAKELIDYLPKDADYYRQKALLTIAAGCQTQYPDKSKSLVEAAMREIDALPKKAARAKAMTGGFETMVKIAPTEAMKRLKQNVSDEILVNELLLKRVDDILTVDRKLGLAVADQAAAYILSRTGRDAVLPSRYHNYRNHVPKPHKLIQSLAGYDKERAMSLAEQWLAKGEYRDDRGSFSGDSEATKALLQLADLNLPRALRQLEAAASCPPQEEVPSTVERSIPQLAFPLYLRQRLAFHIRPKKPEQAYQLIKDEEAILSDTTYFPSKYSGKHGVHDFIPRLGRDKPELALSILDKQGEGRISALDLARFVLAVRLPKAAAATWHDNSHGSVNHRHPGLVETLISKPDQLTGILSKAKTPEQLLSLIATVCQTGDRALQMRLIELSTWAQGSRKELEIYQDRDLWSEKERWSPEARLLDNFYNMDGMAHPGKSHYQETLQQQPDLTLLDLLGRHWLTREDVRDYPFPIRKGTKAQHRWYADRSLVALSGFNQLHIGHLISKRLEQGRAGSVHDASQILSVFKVPKQYYDVSALREAEAVEFDQLANYEHKLYSPKAEKKLILAALGDLSAEDLRKLPGNANPLNLNKYGHLFYDDAHCLLYGLALLYQQSGTTPDGVRLDFSAWLGEYADSDEVQALISAMQQRPQIGHRYEREETEGRTPDQILAADFMFDDLGPNVTARPADDKYLSLWQQAGKLFLNLTSADLKSGDTFQLLHKLKTLSAHRKQYIDDATDWLTRHTSVRNDKLVRAWGDRPLALAHGVEDRAEAIISWAKKNAFYIAVGEYTAKHEVSQDDMDGVLDRFAAFVPELTARYAADESLKALLNLEKVHNPAADFPAATITLNGGYTFEIVDKNSPDGLTIGYDTGCCMTLGGISEDCIWAGYSDQRYGFCVLREPSGKIVAQSLLWHNPDDATGVMVLDNIETNRGRNIKRVKSQFQKALQQYFSSGISAAPIRKVHLGTGYLEISTEGLSPVKSVKRPTKIYTDAEDQVLLLSVK